MPDTTGPWWVEDQETGHKYVTYVLGDHLTVSDESPWTNGGTLRPAEPATHSKPTEATKEAGE